MLRVLITTALLLSSIAIFFLLSLPHYEALQIKMVELEGEQKKFEARDEYVQGIMNVHAEIDRHDDEVKKIKNALPDDHHIPSLFLAIKKMEREAGIGIEHFGSFTTRESRAIQGLRETEFSINGNGSYFNLRRFIYHLENGSGRSDEETSIESLSRVIEIEELVVSYLEGREETGSPLAFILNVKTYSY